MRYSSLLMLVSSSRLNRYLRASNNIKPHATQLYLHNIELSGDLFKTISFFEIAFRNRLNNIAPQALASIEDDWLFSMRRGEISKSPDFKPTRRKIAEAIKQSKDGSHDQLVCQLSFGFWCSLFSGYNYTVVGSKLLKQLHPRSKINPRELRTRLHRTRLMRNRIAHHEPVIFDKYDQYSTTLIDRALADLNWLSRYFANQTDNAHLYSGNLPKNIAKLKRLINSKNPAV